MAGQRFLTLRYEIDGSQPSPRELRAPPARKPTDESAQHQPELGRERNVAGHADEDAERQARHGANRDCGSDAHVRESTFAPVAPCVAVPWLRTLTGRARTGSCRVGPTESD